MSKKYLADKPTLDEVNEKIGNAGGSSVFAQLNSIISAIADHVAIWTAAKAGNLDTTVSSRAPASTALSTAQWMNTRAGYLDKLNSGVAVSSLAGKLVKSVQRGRINCENNTKDFDVTINSVNMARSLVIAIPEGGYSAMAYLTTATNLHLYKSYMGGGGCQVAWQVIEFY